MHELRLFLSLHYNLSVVSEGWSVDDLKLSLRGGGDPGDPSLALHHQPHLVLRQTLPQVQTARQTNGRQWNITEFQRKDKINILLFTGKVVTDLICFATYLIRLNAVITTTFFLLYSLSIQPSSSLYIVSLAILSKFFFLHRHDKASINSDEITSPKSVLELLSLASLVTAQDIHFQIFHIKTWWGRLVRILFRFNKISYIISYSYCM